MKVKDLADYSYCKRKLYLSKRFGLELLDNHSENVKFVNDTVECLTSSLNCNFEVKKFAGFIESETNKLVEGKKSKVLFGVNLKSGALSGRVDELIITDGEIVPVKFKLGNNSKNVWDSEKIEMIAYSYLVQNTRRFNGRVKTAKIFYADETVKTIHLNELSFKLLNARIKEINALLDESKPPRISRNRSKCEACSFKDFCYSLPY